MSTIDQTTDRNNPEFVKFCSAMAEAMNESARKHADYDGYTAQDVQSMPEAQRAFYATRKISEAIVVTGKFYV